MTTMAFGLGKPSPGQKLQDIKSDCRCRVKLLHKNLKIDSEKIEAFVFVIKPGPRDYKKNSNAQLS